MRYGLHGAAATLLLALAALAGPDARAEDAPPPTLREVLSPSTAPAPPSPAAPAAPAAQPASTEPLRRDTPRGSVDGFLHAVDARDWHTAASYLDLTGLPASAREEEGAQAARALAAVLAGSPPIAVDALSAEPAGRDEPGLPASRERIATLRSRRGDPVDLVLRRRRVASGSVWLVDRTTLEGIEGVYATLGARRLAEEHLPAIALRDVAGLALWQWAGLAAVVVAAVAIATATASLLARLLERIARRTRSALDDRLAIRLAGPVGLAWATGLVSLGRRLLEIPYVPSVVLASLETAALIAAAAWAATRLVDLVADSYRARLAARGAVQIGPLISIGARVAKAAALAIAVATALDNAGFDVTALLTGLGIGGIAVALAAQKSLENLFGGITLLVDRPVRIGELCRVGSRIGRIEEIGPRSTRFRTLDWTLVSIPNAQLASVEIESLGSRTRMLFHPTLAIRYDTKRAELPSILEALRERMSAHPRVDRSTVRAHLLGFAASAITIELAATVLTESLDEYAACAQQLLLGVVEVLEARGSGLAFSGPPVFR